MLTKNDMRIGLRVIVPVYDEMGTVAKAVVIGIDPFEGKWVVACPEWVFGVSHLEENDYELMELDKDV